MKRTLLLLVGVGLVAAACGGTPDVIVETKPPDVFVENKPPQLAIDTPLPGTVLPETQSPSVMPGIMVSGRGEASGMPDSLDLELGVEVFRASVSDAMGEAARLADGLLAALKEHGIAAGDMNTADFSVYPEFDYRSGRERIIGYRVGNMLSVKFRDIDAAGGIIDAAGLVAGDSFRVHSVRFTIDDHSALIQEARAAAWEDALGRATQLAELSGIELGAPIRINEAFTPIGGPTFFGDRLYAASSETSFEPGVASVGVTIEALFAIAGGSPAVES